MKRILMLAIAAALSVGASACQDNTSPGAVLSGTYTLQSIDNAPPPVTLYQDVTGGTQVLGGQIEIDRNGTFTDVVTYRDFASNGAAGAPYNDTIYGTWALSGNTLQFYDSRDPSNQYYATVNGNQLVFLNTTTTGTQYTTIYMK
jgi:hypothetical protein